mmetsp:Transcript_33928/g.72324  ORF Transcript_33928/g.72324 Transcript_33928/m.72324 type:complete len:225 (-) Transcript_33928:294-968(-)
MKLHQRHDISFSSRGFSSPSLSYWLCQSYKIIACRKRFQSSGGSVDTSHHEATAVASVRHRLPECNWLDRSASFQHPLTSRAQSRSFQALLQAPSSSASAHSCSQGCLLVAVCDESTASKFRGFLSIHCRSSRGRSSRGRGGSRCCGSSVGQWPRLAQAILANHAGTRDEVLRPDLLLGLVALFTVQDDQVLAVSSGSRKLKDQQLCVALRDGLGELGQVVDRC